MNELITAIKAWPIIVQGALGSALFWLILLIAQKGFEYFIAKWSTHSKKNKKSWLISQYGKIVAFTSKTNDTSAVFALSAVTYRSLRPAYRGFMWLSLGLITYPFIDIGLTIGGIGAVYYFLKAYEVVSPINPEKDLNEELGKIKQQLEELEILNKPNSQ